MFKYLINFLLFISFASFSYADLHTGVITSCSQQSDWKNQVHQVHLKFTLDGEENKLFSMLINLNVEEMIEFTADEGLSLTIIDELPDECVGQSLFQVQLGEGEGARLYEGKGFSIGLKAEDWGVDENSFKDSHWTPSPEEMASVRTVTSISKWKRRNGGEGFNVILSGSGSAFFFSTPPVKVGNRWIEIEGGWVDLDAAKIFIRGSHGITTIRDIVKTWE